MKKLLFLFLVMVTMSLLDKSIIAQCVPKKVIDSCSVFPKEYIFSKARVISIESKGDVKKSVYSVILTKGNSYVITVCQGKAAGKVPMVVNLLDNQDRLLMSNHNTKNDKYYNKIIFNCNSSGTYNLAYQFNSEDMKGCGVSAFGFQKR